MKPNTRSRGNIVNRPTNAEPYCTPPPVQNCQLRKYHTHHFQLAACPHDAPTTYPLRAVPLAILADTPRPAKNKAYQHR